MDRVIVQTGRGGIGKGSNICGVVGASVGGASKLTVVSNEIPAHTRSQKMEIGFVIAPSPVDTMVGTAAQRNPSLGHEHTLRRHELMHAPSQYTSQHVGDAYTHVDARRQQHLLVSTRVPSARVPSADYASRSRSEEETRIPSTPSTIASSPDRTSALTSLGSFGDSDTGTGGVGATSRTPRAARPSYTEEQRFYIMWARIVCCRQWPEIENSFRSVFGPRRSKEGLTSVYYRIRKSWGLPEVLQTTSPKQQEREKESVRIRANGFSTCFLNSIGYLNAPDA